MTCGASSWQAQGTRSRAYAHALPVPYTSRVLGRDSETSIEHSAYPGEADAESHEGVVAHVEDVGRRSAFELLASHDHGDAKAAELARHEKRLLELETVF